MFSGLRHNLSQILQVRRRNQTSVCAQATHIIDHKRPIPSSPITSTLSSPRQMVTSPFRECTSKYGRLIPKRARVAPTKAFKSQQPIIGMFSTIAQAAFIRRHGSTICYLNEPQGTRYVENISTRRANTYLVVNITARRITLPNPLYHHRPVFHDTNFSKRESTSTPRP